MPIEQFRIATLADVDNVVTIVNQAYRPDPGTAGWTHEAYLLSGSRIDAAQLQALMAMPGSVVLVGSSQGAIICCVHLKKEGTACHVGMLAVKPSIQGSGIGKQMLAYAENYAAEHFAAEKLVMAVLSARTELMAFYARRGYQKNGTLLEYPSSAGVGTPLTQNLTLEVLEKKI